MLLRIAVLESASAQTITGTTAAAALVLLLVVVPVGVEYDAICCCDHCKKKSGKELTILAPPLDSKYSISDLGGPGQGNEPLM